MGELFLMKHPNRQGRKRALTPTQVAEVATKLARGATKKALAEEYGVSINTIRRSLTREETPQPLPHKPCGTNAAYERHRKNGEIACEPCLAAHRQARLEYIKSDPTYKEKRKQWNKQRYEREKLARRSNLAPLADGVEEKSAS